MSELEDRLNAVLSNPEEMSRIAAMAQKLMGNLPSENAAPAAPEPPGGGLLGGLAGSLPGLLSRLTSGQSGNGKKQHGKSGCKFFQRRRIKTYRN